MSKIEQAKSYTGSSLETIFFRPMLTGPSASDLGIRVMYNMPVPTTLQFWKRSGDILQKFTSGGWSGSNPATKFQKTIELSRVKAEMGYGADDYFNLVYELISARPDVNMDDLGGTELEEAETALFKESVAESIRATMWLGDTSRASKLNTFNGFLKRIIADAVSDTDLKNFAITTAIDAATAESTLKKLWDSASDALREAKSQGNLAYFVTSDIYAKYEESLDSSTVEAAYLARQSGRESLQYRGIPVIDLRLSSYQTDAPDMPKTFAMLTDRRNMALAVNTSDFPGTEVKMWYNPDQMENRQRAIFMAGCDYLLPEMITFAYKS